MKSLSRDQIPRGKPSATALWQWDGPPVVTGCGAKELLTLELTAFLASRQCPGTAIRAAIDWAVKQASARRAVVSGFHSPLEQSVLEILMTAGSPAVVVLARPVAAAKLPPEWKAPLVNGHMAVVSGVGTASRLTQQLAAQRNDLVVQLAQSIAVAHTSPDGSLALLVERWSKGGREVDVLSQ